MLCQRLMKAKKRRRPNPSSSSSTSPVELYSEGEPWAHALSAERKHGSNGSGRLYGSRRSNRSDPRTSSACAVTRAYIGRKANGLSAIAPATATDSRLRTASRPNLMLMRNGERPSICSAYVGPAPVPSRPPSGNCPPASVGQEVRDAAHPSLLRHWSSSTSTTSRELYRRLVSSREPFPSRTEAASETVRPASERGRDRRRRRRGDQLSPPRSANAGDMRVTPRVGAWRSRFGRLRSGTRSPVATPGSSRTSSSQSP